MCWSKNCVAIGLAAGFLEPLESTGIHLIQRGIALLLNYFPDRHFRQPDIDRYNRQIAFEYERIRDFLIVHYNKTEREGAFWDHCRNIELPESLKERLELFRSYGRIVVDQDELFTTQSWLYLSSGRKCSRVATTRSPSASRPRRPRRRSMRSAAWSPAVRQRCPHTRTSSRSTARPQPRSSARAAAA